MSVIAEIAATWRDPAASVGRLLQQGPREDRSLVILFAACLLLFMGQWPLIVRAAHFDPTTPIDAKFGGALLACVFILPLLAYVLAWLTHVALRAVGFVGTAHGARVALFWALLAIAPAMLLQGLLAGFLGPEHLAVRLSGLIVFGLFLWFWGRGLFVAYVRVKRS